MTRARYFEVATASDTGRPLPGVTVNVYNVGTTTPITATIYSGASGTGVLTNPLTANSQGEIEFWLADPAEVDLRWSKTGTTAETHTVGVLAPLSPGTYSVIGHTHAGAYILAAAATGVAATDTANLQAAIAATITTFGPDGGPVHLWPTTAAVPYRLTATGTLTLPKAGRLIGAGSGGRSLDGGAVPPNPDRVCTKIDCTLMVNAPAIDLGVAGSGQVVKSLYLQGIGGTFAALSKYGGNVAILGGYYAMGTILEDIYINEFSNQVVLYNSYHATLINVHGKRSGVHGLIAYADVVLGRGSSEGLVVRDCLFADSGLNTGVVTATHRPGNIILENVREVQITGPITDECFNGSAAIGVIGICEDITISTQLVYTGNAAGNVGIQVGDGTNVCKRVKVNGTHVRPYDTTTPGSKGIVVAALAEDTVLVDVTSDLFTAGNEIQDAGTRTVVRNTNARYAAEVLADGPSAYWRLGERAGKVARDEISACHGTYMLAPTLGVAGATGDTNKAVTFNGSTQYATVPDSAFLDLGDVFTLECWAKTGGGGVFAMVSKGANAYLFEFHTSGNTLYLEKAGAAAIVLGTTALTLNAWNHCAVTKNGATVKLYLNGVDITGTVTNATFADTATALEIGRRADTAGAYWNGSLDEVAVYPTALSAARIAAHYAAR